jgi:hypothetical protein
MCSTGAKQDPTRYGLRCLLRPLRTCPRPPLSRAPSCDLSFCSNFYASVSAIARSPGVWWIDNYSKLLPRSLVRQNLGLFDRCLWTVKGFSQPVGMDLSGTDFSVRADLPAMPANLLDPALKALFMFEHKAREVVSTPSMFAASASKDCRSIPLRDRDTRSRKRVKYHNMDLLEPNVSSNVSSP